MVLRIDFPFFFVVKIYNSLPVLDILVFDISIDMVFGLITVLNGI